MSEQEMIEYFGLDDKKDFIELSKGSLKQPPMEKYELDRWVKEYLGNQRVFLNEAKAAAIVGLDVKEFRKHPNAFDACRFKQKDGYYFTHKLKDLYSKSLREKKDIVYSTREESNKVFCNSIGAKPIPCHVCGKKAVSHICENCGNPICPACKKSKDRKSKFEQYICTHCLDKKRG